MIPFRASQRAFVSACVRVCACVRAVCVWVCMCVRASRLGATATKPLKRVFPAQITSLSRRSRRHRGASPGYAEISRLPSAHSFLSVVLQPRRKKQVLLNRQEEQVVRAAAPETRLTHRLRSHQRRCAHLPVPFRLSRFLGFASKCTLFPKGKAVYENSKSQSLSTKLN